jgi:hypothetical protein
MAETLRQAGIQVALIVAFDPMIRGTVPANVHLLENFYLSDGVGKPLQQGENFRGSLKNVDLKSSAELGHVSVTTFPSIQKQILRDVLAANNPCRRIDEIRLWVNINKSKCFPLFTQQRTSPRYFRMSVSCLRGSRRLIQSLRAW